MTYLRFITVVVLFFTPFATNSLAAEVERFVGAPMASFGEDYNLMVGDKQFLMAEILSLPAFQVKIDTPFGVSGTFVGVKLREVLSHAGIETFQRIFVRASNDYKATVSSDDPGIDQALLVYSVNGKPLALNDKGPYWLIWPQQAETLLKGETTGTKWVWSVVNIRKIK